MPRNISLLLAIAVIFQTVSLLVFLLQFYLSVVGIEGVSLSWRQHELIELMAILGLGTGSALAWWMLWKALRRNRRVEEQLSVASEQFHQMLRAKFAEWGLSEAEKDVALMTIKGFSIAETAGILDKSEGTIKAQSSEIYRKSGLAGRLQLLAYFVGELTETI